jgi:hypothetical protein
MSFSTYRSMPYIEGSGGRNLIMESQRSLFGLAVDANVRVENSCKFCLRKPASPGSKKVKIQTGLDSVVSSFL